MFLRKSIFGTASMLGLAGILSFSGCSAESKDSDSLGENSEREKGGISLGLTLPDGSEVNDVQYVITRAGTTVRTGTIAIGANGVASTEITGLEVGAYRVELTAARNTPTGAAACVGSAEFTVVESTTTNVNVTLQCDDESREGNVTINGSFNICPKITATTVTPTTVSVGSSASLTATARDKDGDAISYAWTAASGTFSSATTANTSYTCTAAGAQSLKLSVTDGPTRGCTKERTIEVTCVEASIDSGTPTPDSGTVAPDAGSVTPDSGTVVPDSGTVVPDSGTVVPDAGTVVPDSGTVVPDAGTVTPDSGTVTPDSGTSTGYQRPAACESCLATNCVNWQGELDVYSNQFCTDAACLAVINCAEQNKCASNPLDTANCYCGAVATVDECIAPAYQANGVCKSIIEANLVDPAVDVGESAGVSKQEFLERAQDIRFAGGRAGQQLQCMAESCAAECLVR